ncbi:hypothetical protein [Pseudothermotoga hypogea]|nr:hypothetical protein [Pseudothermotoga hypogea]
MGRLLRIPLLCCALVLLLFGCGASQEQKSTIEKLAEDLIKAIENFFTSPNIYLAVIFVRDGNVVVYPKPIAT